MHDPEEIDELMESYDCLEDVLDELLDAGDLLDQTHELGGEA